MKRLKILLTTISIIGLFGLLLSCPADNKSQVETFNYDHLKGEWESNSLGWLIIISDTKLEVSPKNNPSAIMMSYDILSVDSKKITVRNPNSGATENMGYEKISDDEYRVTIENIGPISITRKSSSSTTTTTINNTTTTTTNNSTTTTIDNSTTTTIINTTTTTIGNTTTTIVKTPLATPTNLRKDIAETTDSVTFSWDSVANASSYEVYRSSSSTGTYTKIETNITITGTSAAITGLNSGTIYYFKVKAIGNNAYSDSQLSDSLRATTVAKTQLATPTNLKGDSVTTNSITLLWDNVTNASGYEIHQSSSSTGTYTKIETNITITGTSAAITGLNSGTIYYYKVMAIGTGNYSNSQLSNYIRATTITAKKINAGNNHSLIIDLSGNLWAWGNNSYGQLGDGTTTRRTSPVQIKSGTKFNVISGGNSHSLAIDESDNLWAWGNNSYGQLGDGTNTSENTPFQIKAGTKFTTVAGGYGYSLAIDSSGGLWAWGYNIYGQLGDGTSGTANNKSTPVPIKAETRFTSVAAGYYHSLAIDWSGNLWAWGYNSYGALGDGTTTNKSTPVQIKSGTKFATVAAGNSYVYSHSLAIDLSGNLWVWGDNYYGQLGDGTTTQRNSPVQIKSGTKFNVVAAGYGHSLAIDNDGNLWAWGRNNYGQFGDGTTTDKSTPVQIKSGTKFTTVAAGNYYSLAIDNDGNLWAWGDNSYGQFGDGTTTDQNNPKKVLPFMD